ESIPMKSLKCYNDYNSEVTCTWMERSEAHDLVGMVLYQRDDINTEDKDMFCKSQTENDLRETPDKYVHWVCHRTTDYFGIGIKDTYGFRPKKELQTELDVNLFQNVQPLPPQNLSVSSMTSGDFLLTWKTADGNQGLGNALDYEVAYKREWESWEEAALLSLSHSTRCSLSRKDLVPGSSYVARVRARPGQGSTWSGQFSQWSLAVSWKTPEGGLQPRNLRCLFNGGDGLTCSWEVKEVITTSVLFGLFFRATPASEEEECSPVHEKILPNTSYVVQSCEIRVNISSNQSQYHVSVRAKTEEKSIEAYKNIQVLPPANVTVTATENQEYKLNWIKHRLNYNFITQRYQVKYWENNRYEEVTYKVQES
ncbi:IL3RB protein, partial [Cercotrichas coryphoeus]|nr:IL3RB protein [Cercotrichas coryphoeus]